nr:MAG TPA: hypothetical protein [Caudoviricetes sp.]
MTNLFSVVITDLACATNGCTSGRCQLILSTGMPSARNRLDTHERDQSE